MPNYSYTAKDFYGKSVKGNLEAENERIFWIKSIKKAYIVLIIVNLTLNVKNQ